ncbi:MAG: type II toxin-antitoxin system RelE/ParE family toxin [Burkholderiales bacterium]|nr:type II toxin-antitoxin system RelE/ParE family toxin [Burkholderiales bacterium]
MTLPVVYRRRVQHDLAAAFDWYEEQRTQFGEQFLSAVQSSFRTIERYPELFEPVHGEVRRAIVPRFPFAVFYIVEPHRTVVLRVLHTARNPALWPVPKRPER